MIKERSSTALRRWDVDGKRIKRLSAMSRKGLIEMAVMIDMKLRGHGEYIPPAGSGEDRTCRRMAFSP